MSVDISDEEQELVESFIYNYFRSEYDHDEDQISDDEEDEIEDLIEKTADHFTTAKDIPGLVIDFLMVAEEISQEDAWLNSYRPDVTRDDILTRYENVGDDTLTLDYGDNRAGIRPVHNAIVPFFHDELQRTNFPTAYGHRTGKWSDYDFMERCFRLSRAGRFEAALRSFEICVDRLQVRDFVTREEPFPDPFLEILNDFNRSNPSDEPGGAAFQGLCFGYVRTEWNHLSFRVEKARTGSRRQARVGDIDAYMGPDLILSAEIKDRTISGSNVNSELGTMIDLAENTDTISLAICDSVTDDARDEMEEAGVKVLDEDDLRENLEMWDYHKQNQAVQAMVHYYANVEQNPSGTQRLLEFINQVDPTNTALGQLNNN